MKTPRSHTKLRPGNCCPCGQIAVDFNDGCPRCARCKKREEAWEKAERRRHAFVYSLSWSAATKRMIHQGYSQLVAAGRVHPMPDYGT